MTRIVPTLAEMLASCGHNRDVAERQLNGVRERMRREPPGPDRERLRIDLSRYKAEFDHWADYAGYYRKRVAAEGGGTRPKLGWVMDQPTPMSVPTREPGADD